MNAPTNFKHLTPNLFLYLISFFILQSCNVSKKLETQPTTPIPEKTTTEAPTTTRPTAPVATDWQKGIKGVFRESYQSAVKNHTAEILQKYPVILQDFLNMTLIRTNGERVRFKMKKKRYFTLAHTTHPPITIYNMLKQVNFQMEKDSTFEKLTAYHGLLKSAQDGVRKVTHLTEEERERSTQIIDLTEEYLSKILQKKSTTQAECHAFAKTVQVISKQNLNDAAADQLNQFHQQMQAWKKEFPEENWEELRVAIYGFHQPREMYGMKLFFQWLLDEPKFEKRVVYVEFQMSPFGPNRIKAQEMALELITKVDLDKEVALFFLGDETLLQQDVLGPATAKMLEEWGDTDWFSN